MYNVNMSGYGFGALIEGATKGSSKTRILQKHLKQAGFDPGVIDGSYGTKTQAAMQKWQAAQGYSPTPYPNALVFEGLGIPPQNWVGIAEDTGTPTPEIGKIKLVASRMIEAEAPLPEMPLPGEPATEVVTLPSGEQIVVEKTVEVPAAAAAVSGTKEWFKKNWPYLAVGGGLSALAIIAAVLWTRKKDEEELPMPRPEDVEHMAGFMDWEHPYSWHKEQRDHQEEQMLGHRRGAWMGSMWRTPAERDALRKKMFGT